MNLLQQLLACAAGVAAIVLLIRGAIYAQIHGWAAAAQLAIAVAICVIRVILHNLKYDLLKVSLVALPFSYGIHYLMEDLEPSLGDGAKGIVDPMVSTLAFFTFMHLRYMASPERPPAKTDAIPLLSLMIIGVAVLFAVSMLYHYMTSLIPMTLMFYWQTIRTVHKTGLQDVVSKTLSYSFAFFLNIQAMGMILESLSESEMEQRDTISMIYSFIFWTTLLLIPY